MFSGCLVMMDILRSLFISHHAWLWIYLECEGLGEINLDCEQRPWRARAARQSPTCIESSTVAPFARQILVSIFIFWFMSYFCIYSEVRVHIINPGGEVLLIYLVMLFGWISLVWRAKGT